MAQRRLLVITHGTFGIELLHSCEMFFGEIEDADALALMLGQSVDDLRNQAQEILKINESKGCETIVLCDLPNASPFNVALACLRDHDVSIVTGISMPLMIELLQGLNDVEDTDELIQGAIEVAKDNTKLISRKAMGK